MFKAVYITRFFFICFGGSTGFVILGFYLPFLMYLGLFALVGLIALTLLDILILFSQSNPITAQRELPQRLNLGDSATIKVVLQNNTGMGYRIELFDEPPAEMQARDLSYSVLLSARSTQLWTYDFKPTKRGHYEWGNLHLFVKGFFRLTERRSIIQAKQSVPVYPSILQMQRFEFLNFERQTMQKGIKKMRRIGHNNEFEQIKNYVQGDDIRTINWKATSRVSSLMVNQYQEIRSQNVYAIIDKSRSMQHDFDGLTLLDHAINSTLVFSNIALRKGDKMGMLTFSHKIGTYVPPNLGKGHLQYILNMLYAQKTEFKDANYPLLFLKVQKQVATRSLLMLYTNFETELSMQRALPVLKRMNKKHVLVVVLFENTDLDRTQFQQPSSMRELYMETLTEDVINIKKRIAIQLRKHGIHTVLTTPQDLNVDSINKYLELKSRGII